ncbi:hypothetical protein GA0070613_0007 [Micromonospora inositola]|uniref:Uncharacterized protein n=1 Tax=Micromonospora inositola TaxID=47865 RepID=A0A1C5GK43_9ACTN|nr:hypothetical protein GA0070613_0007 [Micromonospora inositola]
MLAEGKRILSEGRRKFESVERLIPLTGPTDQLHKELREALRALRSAMNWLEGTPRFEIAHLILDDAGRLARKYFPRGCRFPYEDGMYHQRCPVALAHNRVGLSPAFAISEIECSVCKLDPDDCDHIAGFEYDGQVCHHLIKKAELLEISIVGRPNMPDARIESLSIGNDEFRARIGERFKPGMKVVCDRCLNECDGISRNFERSSH